MRGQLGTKEASSFKNPDDENATNTNESRRNLSLPPGLSRSGSLTVKSTTPISKMEFTPGKKQRDNNQCVMSGLTV